MAKQLYYGPLWPLGHIAVDYRGTGESLIALVAAEGRTETSEYQQAAALGLIISPCRSAGSADAANTGFIYLCMLSPVGTFDSLGYPGTVVCAIPPASGPVQIPAAQYGGNKLPLFQLGIDADVNGDGAYVCAIMQ